MSEAIEYADATGQMESITVSGPAGTVHGLSYEYDIYGNLEYQATSYAGVTASESFYYDDLHRLVQSNRTTPAGSATVNYDYDPSGNLTLKEATGNVVVPTLTDQAGNYAISAVIDSPIHDEEKLRFLSNRGISPIAENVNDLSALDAAVLANGPMLQSRFYC